MHFKWDINTATTTVNTNTNIYKHSQVTATDLDIDENARITYSLVVPPPNSSSSLKVDPVTGVLSNAVHLDRESSSRIRAVIRATDGGSPALHRDVEVIIALTDVNDNAPKFKQVSSPHCDENGRLLLALLGDRCCSE